ncbi:hypothetical protein BGZ52_000216, partial [Haplosporangium bisporale]
SLYVIPLGKVPADKPEWLLKTMDRDHPLVIQQRFKGILLTSILAIMYLWCMFAYTGAIPTDLVLTLLDIISDHPSKISGTCVANSRLTLYATSDADLF